MKKAFIIIGIGILSIVGFVVWSGYSSTQANQKELSQLIAEPKAVIVASATCGCCKLYGQYMKEQGFTVDFRSVSQEEADGYKDTNEIPANLRSCHTTRIGDYVIEGHIPMEAITKLLKEKPSVKGIALPGMPSASPGMPGPKLEPFEIRIITNDGKDGGIFIKL
ncbi:MAG: DUF411 domain-containing protein [Patescibacteria group bacterium]